MAKLAGVPDPVIKKAKGYLAELEAGGAPVLSVAPAQEDDQMSFMSVASSALADRIAALDLNTITPLEALNLLYQLKKEARGG